MNDPEPGVGWAEALGPAADNPPNPTSNGWVLYHRTKDRLTGQPVTEQYVVPALQNRHKAQFELWVRGEALKSVSEVTDEEMRDSMMSVYQSDYANGHYKWDDNFDGKKVKAARKSVRGALQLLYLLMRTAKPGLTEERAFEVFAADTDAAVTAYRWAMGNWQAPTTERAGGGADGGVRLTAEETAEVLRKRAVQGQPSQPKTMDSPASA